MPMENTSGGFVTQDDTSIIESISPTYVTSQQPCISKPRAYLRLQRKPLQPVVDSSFNLPSSSCGDRTLVYKPKRDLQCSSVFTLRMIPSKQAKLLTMPQCQNLDVTRFVNPSNDEFVPPHNDPYLNLSDSSPHKKLSKGESDRAAALSTASASTTCPSVKIGLKRNLSRAFERKRIAALSSSPAKISKNLSKCNTTICKSSKYGQTALASALDSQNVVSQPRLQQNKLITSHLRKCCRSKQRLYYDAFKFCHTDTENSSIHLTTADFPVSFLQNSVSVENDKADRSRSTICEHENGVSIPRECVPNKKGFEDREKLFKERSLHEPEALTQYFHSLTKQRISESEKATKTDSFYRSSIDTQQFKWNTTLQISNKDAVRIQSVSGMSYRRPPIKGDTEKGAPVLKTLGVPLPMCTLTECAIQPNRIGFTSDECQAELQKLTLFSNNIQSGNKDILLKKCSTNKNIMPTCTQNFQQSSQVQAVSFVKDYTDGEQTVRQSVQRMFDDMLYHVDAADMVWLQLQVSKSTNFICFVEFQQIVQIFEMDSYMKRCTFQIRKLQLHRDRATVRHGDNDQNNLCSICLLEIDDDGDVGGLLVICHGCNVVVHASCYGVSEVPFEAWFCDSCHNGHPFPSCYFCPLPNGAVHLTEDELRFVHTTCAIWHPFTDYTDLVNRQKLEARKYFYNAACYAPCYICGIRYGVVTFCTIDECGKVFHIGCADRCRFWMEEDMRNPAKTKYAIYCYEHSKEKAHAYFALPVELKENRVIVRDPDGRRVLLSESDLQMFDDLEDHFLAFAPKVNDNLFKKFNVNHVIDVFNYWKLKRFTHGRALIDPCNTPSDAFPRFSKALTHRVDIPVERNGNNPPVDLDELKMLHAAQNCIAQWEKDDIAAVNASVTTVNLLENNRKRYQSIATRDSYVKMLKSIPEASRPSDFTSKDSRIATAVKRCLDFNDNVNRFQENCDDCIIYTEPRSIKKRAERITKKVLSNDTSKKKFQNAAKPESIDGSAVQLFNGMVATLGLDKPTPKFNHHVMSPFNEGGRIGFCMRQDDSSKKKADDKSLQPSKNRHRKPVEKKPDPSDNVASDSSQSHRREVDVVKILERLSSFVNPGKSVWAKW